MAMGSYKKVKDPKGPCEHYFGNLCTGMGSSDATCFTCGWDRFTHSQDVRADILRNLVADPDFIDKLEAVELTITDEHNDI